MHILIIGVVLMVLNDIQNPEFPRNLEKFSIESFVSDIGKSSVTSVCRQIVEKFGYLNMSMDFLGKIEETYLRIYAITNIFLKDYMQKGCAIDIRNMADGFGIRIIEKKIHFHNKIFYNQISGYLDIYDYKSKQFVSTIYVDDRLDETGKRYVIAHEFSHYILVCLQNVINDNDFKRTIKYCSNVLFPSDTEEHICDIMTSFFLMPIETVLYLMENFIDKKKRTNDLPVHVEELLWYLSLHLKIPDDYINICFQHTRYLGSYLSHSGFKGIDDSIVIENPDRYDILFT